MLYRGECPTQVYSLISYVLTKLFQETFLPLTFYSSIEGHLMNSKSMIIS